MISWPIVLYTVHQYILQLLGAPVSQKKLQESKAEEKPDTLRNPMALFFSSRIFVVKGQPPENYLNQQRCQQFGRVLSYLPGQTLMIYVQNIFNFVNSVPKLIFLCKLM